MLDPKAQRTPRSPVSPERSPWPVRRQLPTSPLVRTSIQSYARSQEEQNNICQAQEPSDSAHRYNDYMYVSVVTLCLAQT